MKHKIATTTFHCSYNYGSVLQTYALQSVLEDMGHDVNVIDYRSEDFDIYRIVPKKVNKRSILFFARALCFLPRYLRRRRNYQKFWKNYLHLTKTCYTAGEVKKLNPMFDTFICGSDQIWNLDVTKGVDPVYFLEFADDNKRKVAYAPSTGKTSFSKDYSKEIEHAVKRFDYLSVRESASIDLLSTVTNSKIECVLDPTLLLDVDRYPISKPKNQPEGKYIFVYMLGTSKALIDYSRELSRKTGLPILYITRNENFHFSKDFGGKDMFGASPEEFLYLLSHAEYVLTSSFHATVFSVLYEKKFCVFHRENTGIRTMEFIDALGISERAYNDGFDIDAVIEYEKVRERINNMKAYSLDFLYNALS